MWRQRAASRQVLPQHVATGARTAPPWACRQLRQGPGKTPGRAGAGRGMAIVATMQRAEVFLGLDDRDLRRIADLPSCREMDFDSGATLFTRGDYARYLYVLRHGEVELATGFSPQPNGEATDRVVDRITTGGFFGWSALVEPHLYVLSAVCRKPSEAVVIAGAELLALFDHDYRVGYLVFRSLSDVIGARLRDVELALESGQHAPS